MDGAMPLIWRRLPERYNLIGNACTNCGREFFPPRKMCPNCRRKGKLAEKKMPVTGTIVTWTEVFVSPPGFENETPYFLAIIELDNGVRLLAQIVDGHAEKIKTGAKVKKVFRKIGEGEKEDAIAYGYKFKVVE